jgi:competence protein ComEC
LIFNFGKYNFFTAGDLGKNGEEEILDKYPMIKVDFLKLGHHGSNTSTSQIFLNKTKPKVAIVSAGRENRYHHPNPETIQNIKKRNIDIFNTQTNGMIIFSYNRSQIKTNTFLNDTHRIYK